MEKSYYELLDIGEDATRDDIVRAWARKVRVHSPDKDPETNMRLNQAKSILLDPQARSDYNAELVYGVEIAELMTEGEEALGDDDFDAALEYFREVLALHPENHRARMLLGYALFGLGRTPDAIRHTKLVCEAAPSSALYASNLAKLNDRLAEGLAEGTSQQKDALLEAERWYLRAIDLESHNAEHHRSLALFYIEQGRRADCERVLENAIDADGKLDLNDVETLLDLMRIRAGNQDYDGLRSISRRLKEIIDTNDGAEEFIEVMVIGRFVNTLDDFGGTMVARNMIVCAEWAGCRFSKAQEGVSRIKEIGLVEADIIKLNKQANFEPAIIAGIALVIALKKLGEESGDYQLQELLAIGHRESNQTIRTGISKFRQTYPNMSRFIDGELKRLSELGQGGSLQVASSSTSSGCILPLIAALFAIAFAIMLL